MVTKTKVDPLEAELAAHVHRPDNIEDVFFDVEISPYFVQGKQYFRWEIVEHNFVSYIGDYVGHRDAGFYTAKAAEDDARRRVDEIKNVIKLKLQAPEGYRITL